MKKAADIFSFLGQELIVTGGFLLAGFLFIGGILQGEEKAAGEKGGASDFAFVYAEAESFADGPTAGGWLVDPQMIDQVGSAVLLAHGLGQPVEDASKTIRFPASGRYRVFVRTRNWAAPWTPEESPGTFCLAMDGQPLDKLFGTENAEWSWEFGGEIDLAAGNHRVSLVDQTGFDGRCDAIFWTQDPNELPPNDLEGLARLRQKGLGEGSEIPEASDSPFDFVVVGGGMAGICASVAAARLGVKTALIQDRFMLGGNNSSDVRVHLQGIINQPPYPNLGNLVYALQHDLEGNAEDGANYEDEKKLALVRGEKNLHLFLATHVEGVEKEGDRITGVTARNILTNERIHFTAPLFADCSGDGNLGYLAGADWRYGRESQAETGEADAPQEADSMTMGASVQWYAVESPHPMPFPELPWAVQFTPETIRPAVHGDWDWETGLLWNQIDEIEKIRDYGLRAAYGHWAFMKNRMDGEWGERASKMDLGWVSAFAGKRESRRLLGDVILNETDVLEGRSWPDSAVTTTWSVDLHYPEKENSQAFPGEEFRTICVVRPITPYAIPYRCLYSRNIENLLMAGRDISVTHAALGTVRVMRTGGMMGEVVGMAASLCKKWSVTPRGVYQSHLEELKALMKEGIAPPPPGTPEIMKPSILAGRKNRMPEAVLSAPDETPEVQECLEFLRDGKMGDDDEKYVSGPKEFHAVIIEFPETVTVDALRFITRNQGERKKTLYRLEYKDGQTWRRADGSSIKNRPGVDFTVTFSPVIASAFRFVFLAGQTLPLELREVEIYSP